uniref:Uncharacterized protein n=1 Tax=Seriola dumerili TaxID=41447 RepID=A0A3B4V083_SERDU
CRTRRQRRRLNQTTEDTLLMVRPKRKLLLSKQNITAHLKSAKEQLDSDPIWWQTIHM